MKTLIRLMILTLALGAAWLIREQLVQGPRAPMEEHQWVKLIEEPPLPEPEPPPEPEPMEEPPEPEIEEVVEDLPEEAEPATDEALGVDEEGQGGGDGFGLRAKKGGRDLLLSGPAGGRGHQFIAYGGTLTNELERYLMGDPDLRGKNFTVLVKVWIDSAGRIERSAIGQSSGSRETDDRLIHAITSFPDRVEAPPAGMPQPIRIRIRSRPSIG
jgi:TonB family protein